ncbi:MAG TPA: N-acetylmuramoyl-L-alanine amidase [bacterium]|nr:N-acetylmuramoyl-L-alanine amidase [bacterium]
MPVRKFAIHHTATSDGGANPAAAIRAIYYYHAVTLGWGDIGYNYLIDRAGNIYEGRAGGPNAVGAHVEVANEGVDGIALLGTYQDAAPSEAMTTALVSLLAWRSRSAGVDPQGNGPLAGRTVPNILGHRDVMSTDCPGDAAYALLPSIRLQVAAALAPRPPSPTIRVVSTRVSPAAVSVGGDVKVEVTVTNAGTDPIASQGPEPGTSYAEGESFRSIGQPEVPGRIRIGVDLDGGTDPDHRFRWGLGGDLAPGASRTVVGSITFDRPGTRTLSVGVVQEGVAWLLDGLGRTTVVVRPGIAAAYRATSAPATELHFPLVMLRYHGWTTRIHITNTTDRPGVGSLAVLGADGRALSRTPLLLPPRGTVRKTMDFGDDGMGGVAAAVVVADVPLAGVAFHERAEGDWMAVEPVTGGAPRIYVPLAARRYRGLSSGVQVQNLGETRATVWITYLDSAGATWTDSALVPPMGFATFFAPGHATLPDGFVGSAIVESDGGQPLAGQVNLVTAGGAAMAYVAEDSPGPEVLAPLLFRNRGGWRTGLQVQNTGGPVAAIVARYTPVNRPGGPWEREATIPGALAGTLYLPADPLLPDDLVAAAQVRSVRGEPLAVIANSVNDRRRVGTAVGAVGSIGPRLYVPLVSTGVDGQVTGVQVQNVAPQPAPVVVAVFDDRGALLTQFEETIPANGARTLYAPAAPGLGAGSSGSMVVVGRPDARLAAVVTEAR